MSMEYYTSFCKCCFVTCITAVEKNLHRDEANKRKTENTNTNTKRVEFIYTFMAFQTDICKERGSLDIINKEKESQHLIKFLELQEQWMYHGRTHTKKNWLKKGGDEF